MSSIEQPFVIVGQVVGVFGLEGEIKVKSLSDHPRRFTDMPGQRMLWRNSDTFRRVVVRSVRPLGRNFVLAIDGYRCRAEAQTLVGGELVVTATEVLPLPAGSYYCFQLIGLTVLDESGATVGTVREVLKLPSNDVYVVESPGGDILLPALKSIVKEINLAGAYMSVTRP